MKIKQIIEQNDTKAGKIVDLFIQFLIILSLVSFSIETLPDLNEKTKHILGLIEIITVAIFTIEYLLRLIVADNKLKYIFSFYGLIDLAAILPFYVAHGIDLRSTRIIRMFRLARAFKLLRYNRALQSFKNVFLSIKEELILFIIATCFLLYLSAVGIYYFENSVQPEQFKSVFHSLWWAVSTLTTVGYGDVYPITVGGKIFTFFMLIIGLGIIAVPTGLIAAALTKVPKNDEEEDSKKEGKGL